MQYFKIDFYRLCNTARRRLSNLNLQKYQIFIDLEDKNHAFFWHENFGHGGSIEREFCPWDIPICTKTMAFTFPFQNFLINLSSQYVFLLWLFCQYYPNSNIHFIFKGEILIDKTFSLIKYGLVCWICIVFVTFPANFLIPIFFSNLIYNCSNTLDLRNLQEKSLKSILF